MNNKNRIKNIVTAATITGMLLAIALAFGNTSLLPSFATVDPAFSQPALQYEAEGEYEEYEEYEEGEDHDEYEDHEEEYEDHEEAYAEAGYADEEHGEDEDHDEYEDEDDD